jgi:hypothetical protein
MSFGAALYKCKCPMMPGWGTRVNISFYLRVVFAASYLGVVRDPSYLGVLRLLSYLRARSAQSYVCVSNMSHPAWVLNVGSWRLLVVSSPWCPRGPFCHIAFLRFLRTSNGPVTRLHNHGNSDGEVRVLAASGGRGTNVDKIDAKADGRAQTAKGGTCPLNLKNRSGTRTTLRDDSPSV